MLRPAVLLFLVMLIACGGTDGDAPDVGGGDQAGDLDVKGACDAWDPYAELDPATADPCDPEHDDWRDCATSGASGQQRCVYLTTGEDTGVYRWGLCDEACAVASVGTTRACDVNGAPGLHYCSEVYGAPTPLWRACLLPACLACTPGETRLCGPGTNYPDTLMPCILSDGVPQWFAGDCTT